MYAAFMFINATHWRLTCDVQGAFAFTMKKKKPVIISVSCTLAIISTVAYLI